MKKLKFLLQATFMVLLLAGVLGIYFELRHLNENYSYSLEQNERATQTKFANYSDPTDKKDVIIREPILTGINPENAYETIQAIPVIIVESSDR